MTNFLDRYLRELGRVMGPTTSRHPQEPGGTRQPPENPSGHRASPDVEGDIRELLGFKRDDPSVEVTMIPLPESGPYDLDLKAVDKLFDDFFADLNPPRKVFRHPGLDAPYGDKCDTGAEGITGTVTGEAQPPTTPYPEPERITGSTLDSVLAEVRVEVERAVAKHGPMKSPHEAHSVIQEELEELWDEIKADSGRDHSARIEAVQLAAMAVRYLLDIDPHDD